MSNIIVLDNDYNDKKVNYNLINYIINSNNTFEYDARGIPLFYNIWYEDLLNAVQFMEYTQRCYGLSKNDKRLVHIVLAFHDIKYKYEGCPERLMNVALDYFYNIGFQCIAAYHYKSDNNKFYNHIHLVINKVSLNITKFNESDKTYKMFASYLQTFTNSYWGVWRKVSYYDSDLFVPDD